jgi:hypothetical protein
MSQFELNLQEAGDIGISGECRVKSNIKNLAVNWGAGKPNVVNLGEAR